MTDAPLVRIEAEHGVLTGLLKNGDFRKHCAKSLELCDFTDPDNRAFFCALWAYLERGHFKRVPPLCQLALCRHALPSGRPTQDHFLDLWQNSAANAWAYLRALKESTAARQNRG